MHYICLSGCVKLLHPPNVSVCALFCIMHNFRRINFMLIHALGTQHKKGTVGVHKLFHTLHIWLERMCARVTVLKVSTTHKRSATLHECISFSCRISLPNKSYFDLTWYEFNIGDKKRPIKLRFSYDKISLCTALAIMCPKLLLNISK